MCDTLCVQCTVYTVHVYRYHWIIWYIQRNHTNTTESRGKYFFMAYDFACRAFRWLVWIIFKIDQWVPKGPMFFILSQLTAAFYLYQFWKWIENTQIGRWFSSSMTRFQKCVWFPYGMHIISCRLPPVCYSPATVVVVAIVNVNAITTD